MKRILIIVLFTAFGYTVSAQQGYKIDFVVKGLKDTTAYLGHFYGESTYVKDTARINSNGEFSFTGTNKLPSGVYFLVLNKSRIFDLVLNTDQHFKITTDTSALIPAMNIEGDIDNELFHKNLLFNIERNKEAEPIVKILQDEKSSENDKTNARAALQKINDKVIAYQNEIIAQHPNAVISKIYKATRPLDVPNPPAGADSTFGFRYYKEHYWDNFDLADETLLRISEPVYRKKVEEYLDRLFLQHPDTLTEAIFKLGEIAKKNPETYKYFVWTVVLKYQQPEIMGLDEVYVNIYDKYFASGEMDYWANASLKNNLKDQAEKYRRSLIGQKAPNLMMQDENLKPRSLYDIKNKYTIIYFYDPDCGFCKKETPVLKEFYDKTDLDVEVYAVSADSSMAKMKDYIKEVGLTWINVNGPRTYLKPYQDVYDAYSTPTIYVLDENKKIIAKKLPAGRIEEFIMNYERSKKDVQ